ncbi:hypothetical protein GNI_039750 [Gregarina niphandrodes]|uniref:Uncharacterized protein n=1 Tax=Gregarina niphandrodes TaxID=110365 RepID=A0A023BAC4_GRENI|nr:hypothetical protein GNI_039750 [Gregarina niphandrodes]EZG78215.1 hypothetical protein GNI_039750 [Gregarina niphandrodes]|eukprot:XP_011129404.1 hypothetical protein GNI_039750 [Gregarina niphandrodes]
MDGLKSLNGRLERKRMLLQSLSRVPLVETPVAECCPADTVNYATWVTDLDGELPRRASDSKWQLTPAETGDIKARLKRVSELQNRIHNLSAGIRAVGIQDEDIREEVDRNPVRRGVESRGVQNQGVDVRNVEDRSAERARRGSTKKNETMNSEIRGKRKSVPYEPERESFDDIDAHQKRFSEGAALLNREEETNVYGEPASARRQERRALSRPANYLVREEFLSTPTREAAKPQDLATCLGPEISRQVASVQCEIIGATTTEEHTQTEPREQRRSLESNEVEVPVASVSPPTSLIWPSPSTLSLCTAERPPPQPKDASADKTPSKIPPAKSPTPQTGNKETRSPDRLSVTEEMIRGHRGKSVKSPSHLRKDPASYELATTGTQPTAKQPVELNFPNVGLHSPSRAERSPPSTVKLFLPTSLGSSASLATDEQSVEEHVVEERGGVPELKRLLPPHYCSEVMVVKGPFCESADECIKHLKNGIGMGGPEILHVRYPLRIAYSDHFDSSPF